MTEQSTELAEVAKVTTSLEKLKEKLPTIQRGSKIGLDMLTIIQTTPIKSKEERDAAVENLNKVKKIYDKVKGLRKEITDPLDTAKDWIMGFEREMDSSSKAANEYNKAKAVIIAYDQKVIDDNNKKEVESERQRQTSLYKAELKEKVARQLVEMMAGQKRNSIEGMAKWEAGLTLGTIDQNIEALKARKPELKPEFYNACFKTDFPGKKTVITDEELVKWMEEFKKEMPYSKYQEEYMQMATPILNEYRAKMPDVKNRLEAIEKESEDKKLELEKARQQELTDKSLAAMKVVEQETEAKVDQINQDKENAVMDAEFTKQAQLQDLDDGPTKYQASFEGAAWVQPFLNVIGTCIKSDKFKMYNAKGEFIDSITWWLNFLSTNCPKADIPGIVWKEIPKTIIKGK